MDRTHDTNLLLLNRAGRLNWAYLSSYVFVQCVTEAVVGQCRSLLSMREQCASSQQSCKRYKAHGQWI